MVKLTDGLISAFSIGVPCSSMVRGAALAFLDTVPPARRLTLVTRLRKGAQRAFLKTYREATEGLPGMNRGELLDFFLAGLHERRDVSLGFFLRGLLELEFLELVS